MSVDRIDSTDPIGGGAAASASSTLAAASTAPIVNALSIDVEDYFQVSAFENHIPRSDWDVLPCRVERNVERILELLDEAGVHATFFVLGWVAERYSAMIRRIADAGHEVASHGFDHARVGAQSPAQFEADIALAKAVLEDIGGRPVLGYRAPSFSVGPKTQWAFESIAKAGYRYSSSVYPIRHDHYGAPDSPRFAHQAKVGLLELPVATVRVARANLPAGGGGYFRLLPYAVSQWSIRRVNARDRQPAVFYFHPWEIDPDQPRVPGASLKTRFRHYLNLARTEPRLRRLIADFRWDRIDSVFSDRMS
jgi:polysaccharide deacetylase family protein (PEP-CTERM system associated)